MISGQKNTMAWLESKDAFVKKNKVVWMHCSSLGEFEQGRAVLEGLKARMPDIQVVISFFSPSGYEIRKDYPLADRVFYLPPDTRKNAELLLTVLKPDIFIMVKYDFWWNLLRAMRQHNIRVYLIAAHFTPGRYYLKSPFSEIIKSWAYIFTLRENSVNILRNMGYHKVETAGDPRIDRVLDIKKKGQPIPDDLKIFLTKNQPLIIYGSVWPEDVQVLKKFIADHPDIYHVIVPHNVETQHVKSIRNILGRDSSLYSNGDFQNRILIVDKVGFLSGLYGYSRLAYIGGGFSQGIHNTLEAAVYGIPVLFGPRYQKFPEAVELIQCRAAFEVRMADDIEDVFQKLWSSEGLRQQITENIEVFFNQHAGATSKIINHLMAENFS